MFYARFFLLLFRAVALVPFSRSLRFVVWWNVFGRSIKIGCCTKRIQITWIDGSGNVLTAGVRYTKEPSPDSRLSTAKSILKLKANKALHNKTIHCQAQNSADKMERSASIRLEVSIIISYQMHTHTHTHIVTFRMAACVRLIALYPWWRRRWRWHSVNFKTCDMIKANGCKLMLCRASRWKLIQTILIRAYIPCLHHLDYTIFRYRIPCCIFDMLV